MKLKVSHLKYYIFLIIYDKDKDSLLRLLLFGVFK